MPFLVKEEILGVVLSEKEVGFVKKNEKVAGIYSPFSGRSGAKN